MGDKSDLTVDYDLLHDSLASLKYLRREFDRCPQRQDALAEDVGASELKDAMHEFSDNWSDNRKQILKNIDDVKGFTKKTLDSFSGLEDELSKRDGGKGQKN